MKRTIKNFAVIGSGIMGFGNCLPFCNIGVEVLLSISFLRNLLRRSKERIDIRSTVVRNRLVIEHLNTAKAKPSINSFNRITTGNTTDDSKIADVDWIIEVVERLDIKN
jgi:3-hydroxyacyl-CoA dehydrogenase